MATHSTIQKSGRLSSKFLSGARELGLVTASFSGGQLKAGVEYGPDAILKAGATRQLRDLGFSISGDEKPFRYDDWKTQYTATQQQTGNYTRTSPLCSAVTHSISKRTQAHASEGRPVLSLGGDHSVAIGTVSGVAKAMHDKHGKDLAVLWIDAHADLNTPDTSASGNVHGMPLAFLTGIAKAGPHENNDNATSTLPFDWLEPDRLIPASKLVYIGLRDVDDIEYEHIRQHSIRAYSAREVHSRGIATIMDEVVAYIGTDLPIHIGFDIDSLDPTVAPSTGLPVAGGLSLEDGLYIVTRVAETGQVVAMDLVEVNPHIDPEGDGGERTARVAADVITALFRGMRSA